MALSDQKKKQNKYLQAFNEFVDPNLKKARLNQEDRDRQNAAYEQRKADAEKKKAADVPEPNIPNPEKPEIIRDTDSGRKTGVKLPDGRVLLGLKPSEVDAMTNKFTQAQALPQGAQEGGTARQTYENQQQQIAATNQLASPNFGEQAVEPSVSLGQSNIDTGVGLAASTSAIVGGAVAGATAGSVIPGIGTVVGGLVGGITALFGVLAADRRQTTKEAYKVFTNAQGTRMSQIMTMANSGVVPPAEVVRAYEQNLANIRESQRELRNQTNDAVGRQLSGAMDELIQVNLWLENEPYYRAQLIAALQNPNPSLNYAMPVDAEDLNSQLS